MHCRQDGYAGLAVVRNRLFNLSMVLPLFWELFLSDNQTLHYLFIGCDIAASRSKKFLHPSKEKITLSVPHSTYNALYIHDLHIPQSKGIDNAVLGIVAILGEIRWFRTRCGLQLVLIERQVRLPASYQNYSTSCTKTTPVNRPY
jgi:hypothetical protein